MRMGRRGLCDNSSDTDSVRMLSEAVSHLFDRCKEVEEGKGNTNSERKIVVTYELLLLLLFCSKSLK